VLLASKAYCVVVAAPLGRQQQKESSIPVLAAVNMLDFALSPTAEQWIKVVLIWVGFGGLVGLLATVIFPFRRPASPFWAVVAGIAGTTIGLLGLSLLFPDRAINPLNPLGFLAATVGAFALLTLYRLGCALFGKPQSRAPED
jgi:uncharacterized membrane protein YeaQ/YmgE (transglycosylase-associated protein family)